MKKQKLTVKSRDLKAQVVKSLAERISRAKTLVFADYHGLTVNQIAGLRSKIREAGGEMVVAKNTLMNRSLATTDYRLLTTDYRLTGPTAAIFAYDDEISPIRVIAETAKAIGSPKFKFGFLGSEVLDTYMLENLAKIPGRDQLQANFIGAIASPLYGIVTVLAANLRNLMSVLDQAAKR